jgi:hypothetical protein
LEKLKNEAVKLDKRLVRYNVMVVKKPEEITEEKAEHTNKDAARLLIVIKERVALHLLHLIIYC